MKLAKNFLIFIIFLGLVLSCQQENLLNEAKITKSNPKINLKPTVKDALSFINTNLLDSKNLSARGIKDYQLRIDTTYVIPYKNRPFLKLVCFIPKGYALVSDIDNVPNPPVLFYDKNKFDTKNANPALLEYIEEFLLTHSKDSRAPDDNEDKDGDGAWDDGRDTNTGDPRDSPYYYKETVLRTWTEEYVKAPLLSTIWHQSSPYNDDCPTINGQKAAAGCVAIAVGQIMNYHRKNTHGNYNWNRINTGLTPDIQKFIRDIGNGVKMDYGTFNSGGSSSNLSKACSYFKSSGYPKSFQKAYNYNDFRKFININLPVYLRGNESRRRYKALGINLPFFWKYEGGHAWVGDGYKAVYLKKHIKIDRGNKGGGVTYDTRTVKTTNYIHMNWGWGSSYQENGGWCTYDYFRNNTGNYTARYRKQMLVVIP